MVIWMAKRMSIVVFSGSIDRLTGMAVLVSAAAASEYEVYIFLQLWGVYAFKKDVVEKNMNFSEFENLKPQVHEGLVRIKAPSWIDLLKQAKEVGNVKIYACSLATQIWNVSKDDLVDIVDDIIGAAEFIDYASKSDITFFV